MREAVVSCVEGDEVAELVELAVAARDEEAEDRLADRCAPPRPGGAGRRSRR